MRSFRPRFQTRLRTLALRLPILVFLSSAVIPSLLGQAQSPASVQVSLGAGQGSFSVPLQILAILTLLTFLPAIVISMTSFTRIIVVIHFLRQALGTQQAPGNQILIGLTLFLTFFVMGPVLDRVYEQAIVPYRKGEINQTEALGKATVPLRKFMLKQLKEDDLALFVNLAKVPKPKNRDDLPMRAVVPAFMISELKTAFQIGFVLFLPFLIVDMVIASVLLSMGMMQLPPIVISTPFKILLFVLVDGWQLVIGSLVKSF